LRFKSHFKIVKVQSQFRKRKKEKGKKVEIKKIIDFLQIILKVLFWLSIHTPQQLKKSIKESQYYFHQGQCTLQFLQSRTRSKKLWKFDRRLTSGLKKRKNCTKSSKSTKKTSNLACLTWYIKDSHFKRKHLEARFRNSQVFWNQFYQSIRSIKLIFWAVVHCKTTKIYQCKLPHLASLRKQYRWHKFQLVKFSCFKKKNLTIQIVSRSWEIQALWQRD